MRTFLYIVGGLLLGLIIHIAVILTLPAMAANNVASRLAGLAQLNTIVALDPPAPGVPNPLRLDPELDTVVCRLDLAKGPGEVSGTLPDAFWSVAIFDRSGAVIYSTTNRDSVGLTLDLGIFDPAQTRLLAEQKIDVAAGLLIVEARSDDVFAVVRLTSPQPAMRERYRAQLQKLACRNLRA